MKPLLLLPVILGHLTACVLGSTETPTRTRVHTFTDVHTIVPPVLYTDIHEYTQVMTGTGTWPTITRTPRPILVGDIGAIATPITGGPEQAAKTQEQLEKESWQWKLGMVVGLGFPFCLVLFWACVASRDTIKDRMKVLAGDPAPVDLSTAILVGFDKPGSNVTLFIPTVRPPLARRVADVVKDVFTAIKSLLHDVRERLRRKPSSPELPLTTADVDEPGPSEEYASVPPSSPWMAQVEILCGGTEMVEISLGRDTDGADAVAQGQDGVSNTSGAAAAAEVEDGVSDTDAKVEKPAERFSWETGDDQRYMMGGALPVSN